MSASTLHLLLPVRDSIAAQSCEVPTPSRAPMNSSKVIRRRPTPQQGRALEILGHAIEYLVDSRMVLVDEPYRPLEADAVHILSRCSREVFAACAEIVPVQQRFKQWAAERLRADLLHSRHHRA